MSNEAALKRHLLSLSVEELIEEAWRLGQVYIQASPGEEVAYRVTIVSRAPRALPEFIEKGRPGETLTATLTAAILKTRAHLVLEREEDA